MTTLSSFLLALTFVCHDVSKKTLLPPVDLAQLFLTKAIFGRCSLPAQLRYLSIMIIVTILIPILLLIIMIIALCRPSFVTSTLNSYFLD